MKSIFKICAFLLFICTSKAQELSGYWLGTLNVQGQSLRIAFNISHENGHYSTTMDSPDQKAKGIPTQTIAMKTDHIEVNIPNMGVVFKGKLASANMLEGIFSQAGMNLPLSLLKQDDNYFENYRPQHPKKPYPYFSEDVKFYNSSANIHLSGTFTKPNKPGKYPSIILISGSGPQDRNEEIMDHKPFLVLSDYFTKQGFAVLRYDDRGTFKSEGDFKMATTQDFATDVDAAVDYLKSRKDIDVSKIGLIGHSEGGVIAPMVASKRTDIAYIVLLAGTGVNGKTVIVDQVHEINKANGEPAENNKTLTEITKLTFDYLETIANHSDKKVLLSTYLKKLINQYDNFKLPENITIEQFIHSQTEQLSSPWMNFFLFYNPEDALKQVKCPVLAINGSKDLQVTSRLNLTAIEQALKLGSHSTYKIKEIQGLNHLFQECETGSPNEYKTIKQTFSPKALTEISNWLSTLNL